MTSPPAPLILRSLSGIRHLLPWRGGEATSPEHAARARLTDGVSPASSPPGEDGVCRADGTRHAAFAKGPSENKLPKSQSLSWADFVVPIAVK